MTGGDVVLAIVANVWVKEVNVSGVLMEVVVDCVVLRVFFFSSRRRHTRFDCDWSSDVCSSDLICLARLEQARDAARSLFEDERAAELETLAAWAAKTSDGSLSDLRDEPTAEEIGRASCRERV